MTDYIINQPGSDQTLFPSAAEIELEDRLIFNHTAEGRDGSIIEWELPEDYIIKIEALGARGGGLEGGPGAKVSGLFELEAGDKLKILVGQMGLDRYGGYNSTRGGGGGGSFVVDSNNNPLLIAGGGGGYGTGTNHGLAASINEDGVDGENNPGSGGSQGSGGDTGSLSYSGAGGGGLLGDGADGPNAGEGGKSFLNGGEGGSSREGGGGFGGGGGNGWYGGAGGGGYSGGGGCNGDGRGGGGGGSYNCGANQDNKESVNEDQGQIILTITEFYVISGRVTVGPEGVENATVYAIDTDENLLLGPFHTDSNGCYEIESVVKGKEYHLLVQYKTHENKYHSSSYPFITAGIKDR